MTRAALARTIALSSLLALGACATFRGTFAAPRDYAEYRAFRLAETTPDKLARAWRYLQAHPEGEWRAEVEQWFWPEERALRADSTRTPRGAARYLDALPDGPHADAARAYLATVEKEQREGPEKRQRALEAARKRAEAARRAPGEAIEAWARRAAQVQPFREPRAALDATPFGEAYAGDPAPVCDDDGCSKFLSFTYPVPEAEPPLDRTVVVDVRVELTAGVVTAIARVLPKRGFLWWLEGSEAREVDPNDASTRAEAVARARNRVETVVRDAVGGECTTTEADEARVLACGALRVTISTAPDGRDVVRFVRLPAAD